MMGNGLIGKETHHLQVAWGGGVGNNKFRVLEQSSVNCWEIMEEV